MKLFKNLGVAINISFFTSVGAVSIPMVGWFFMGNKVFGFIAVITLFFSVFIVAADRFELGGAFLFYIYFLVSIIFSVCEVVFFQQIYYYLCGYGNLFLDERHASAVFFNPGNDFYLLLFILMVFLFFLKIWRGGFVMRGLSFGVLSRDVLCILFVIALSAILSLFDFVPNVLIEAANLCLLFCFLLVFFSCLLSFIFWWRNDGGGFR